MRTFVGIAALIALFPTVGHAAFSDVPQSHYAATAIDYLHDTNVLQGYGDGTFRPEAPVNRAEALKTIVAQRLEQSALAATTSPFDDVPDGSWFAPYVEAARTVLGIIDGPPDTTTFAPERGVNKAEFVKMLLLAEGVDPVDAFGNLTDGISRDVANPEQWFFPYMRYAVASSMTMVDSDGSLHPGQQLTRAQVAVLLYRYEMFTQGLRTQALLTESDTETNNVLLFLKHADAVNAGHAATRAMLAARGALLKAPNETIVKGAVKLSEGFVAVTKSYDAGARNDLDTAIALAGEAWNNASNATEFHPGLKDRAAELQAIAKRIADDARALQAR